MKQTSNGKSFEYALALAFHKITNAPIQQNTSLDVARVCYEKLDTDHKIILETASNETALFLQAHDSNLLKAKSILLQADGVGIQGDVRDIVIEVPKSPIGISAKHNHTAVKHSRLSDKIDFGKEWADYPCSKDYFKKIQPVFTELREMRTQGMLFKDIKGKDSKIYLPIIIAFEDELKRLCESFRGLFVERFFKYLLGRHDFYKVTLKTTGKNKSVSIQSVNIRGTLGYGSKWKLPDRIHSIERNSGSSSTIQVIFQGGWTISFRLHNASSKVEPSLKFDIQFIGMSSNVNVHNIKIV